MTQKQLRQLQLVQLEIMDEIHRVCVSYGLKYYMIGGTALGSIRHKGFIPWDPDIDIAMPREDYELFVTKYSKELNERYSCHDYRTDKRHYSPHAIIAMNRSCVKYQGSERNPFLTYGDYGIYVDILPLDKVPNDKLLRVKHANQLRRIRTLRDYKVCQIYSSNSWLLVILKILLSFLIPVSLPKLSEMQQRIAQLYNHLSENDYTDICSTLSHYKYEKLCMPKSVWGQPQLYEFEGRQYFGPENMRVYLQLLFGEYMKLPSIEQQEQSLENIIFAEWFTLDGEKVTLA